MTLDVQKLVVMSLLLACGFVMAEVDSTSTESLKSLMGIPETIPETIPATVSETVFQKTAEATTQAESETIISGTPPTKSQTQVNDSGTNGASELGSQVNPETALSDSSTVVDSSQSVSIHSVDRPRHTQQAKMVEKTLDQPDTLAENQSSVTLIQEKPQVVVENKTDESSIKRLDATRITGRKKAFHQGRIGAASQLSRDVILQTQPIGTQELLEKVPGVQSASDDGMGNSRLSIGIRGLNPRRSARVLVLEDGIPIQPGAYIYPNMYYNPPVERLEEVEILKGSGSILYGPQSMGGIINYITRKPRYTPGGMVSLSGGTQGLYSVYGEYGGFGTQDLRPEVQLLYKQGEGFREHNSFDQINTTMKLNWSPSDQEDWYFKLNYNKENTHATYTGITEYTFENDPWFNPKDQDVFEVERLAFDLIHNDYSQKNWIQTTKAYANWFDRKWYRENDIYVRADDYADYLEGDLEFNEMSVVSPIYKNEVVRIGDNTSSFGILRQFYVAGLERSWLFNISEQSELEFGARGHFERFHNERRHGNSGLEGEFSVKDIYLTKTNDEGELVKYETGVKSEIYETTSLAAFVQNRWDLGQFGLEYGARLEVFEQQKVDRLDGARMLDQVTVAKTQIDPFGDAFRYDLPFLVSLGVDYDFNESNNLYAGIHSGFTPPSSTGLDPNIFNVGGSQDGFDLQAERSWTSELGARGTNQSKSLSYEASVFQLDIENQVAVERSTVLSQPARTQSRGFELMTGYSFGDFGSDKQTFDFLPNPSLTYTLMKSKVQSGILDLKDGDGNVYNAADLTGNSLSYVPEHNIQLGLSKKVLIGSDNYFKIEAIWKYKSKMFADIQNIESTGNLGVQGTIPSTPHSEIELDGFSIILPEVVDLNATLKLDQLEFFGAVKNIYGHTYIGSRLHSAPFRKDANSSSGIIVAPGRQIQIGTRIKF